MGASCTKACAAKKPGRKRRLCGRDRRGQIPDRRPIGERPAHIEAHKQVGHWDGHTVIGAGHSQAMVTLVKRKSGYAKLIKGQQDCRVDQSGH
jgi:IS30 family transposase